MPGSLRAMRCGLWGEAKLERRAHPCFGAAWGYLWGGGGAADADTQDRERPKIRPCQSLTEL